MAMKHLYALGLALGLALTLIIVLGRINPSSEASSINQPPALQSNLKPNISTISAGYRHAIHPRVGLAKSQSSTTFTTTDVTNYLKTDSIAQEATSKNLKRAITFVPSQDLEKKLHENFSQNASILCYVEFTGNKPFTLNAVRMPFGAKAPQFTKAYEVFDGQTGDLITWGGSK